MYQRMLRCGAELGSPGGGGGGGAGGRLALLWMVPLTLSGLLGVAWGASSLGAHHLHHFHGSSKHHSVPIAIYRSPASLRGGHGGSEVPSYLRVTPSLAPLNPALPSRPLGLGGRDAEKGKCLLVCLVGATYLFEDNRKEVGEGVGLFVVRGGRGVPTRRGAGRECRGHLRKDRPWPGSWALRAGGLLARRSLCVADGAAGSAEGPQRQRRRLCRTFCLGRACGPTSCPLPWPGGGGFQPARSSEVCPDRGDSEEVGPGTHSTGSQSLLPPPLPLIGEGGRVTVTPSS